jgi:hypothetical protein
MMALVPHVTRAEYEHLDEGAKLWLVKARHRALLLAGLDNADAALVAAHVEIAVEDALALVRRGCPARTALRILL